MLVSLNVKNFAIIDNIQIDFQDGMTVLTGETGAGKSLIIDAIGLLFGKRASNDLIRYGEEKAIIEGVFSIYNDKIKQQLNELSIDYNEEDNLIIKRELHSSGKSICRINNNIVTLSQLSEIVDNIGDIHSQLDTFGLINPKNYISFLNNDKITALLDDYNQALLEYNKNLKEYRRLVALDQDNKAKEDFLRFQLKEYELAQINHHEEAELKEELKYLENFESMNEAICEINNIYYEGKVLDNIYQSISVLEKLEKINPKYTPLKANITDIFYSLEEIINHNDLKIANIDFDANRLEEVNARLAVYSDFRRKYKMSIPEIIEHFEKIKNDLMFIENSEILIKDLKNKVDQYYFKTLNIAKNIREERINISKSLILGVKKHLQDLQLKNVVFDIVFNEIDEENINFKKDGIDEIDFLISFNKGEPPKPLAKTASGGELSRFMLALKTVLGSSLTQQTKIFDEIDHGVSGAVAYSIGEKIKYISKTSQVLCITHLPQVASISDHHFKISKKIEKDRTFTEIIELNEQEKIKEIAAMISKGDPTPASINLAKELINNANFLS